MSTSSHSCPGESQRRRINRRRLAIVGLTAGVLLSSVSCAGRPADKVEGPTFVSYAGTADLLSWLEPAAEEQPRDWARTLSPMEAGPAVIDVVANGRPIPRPPPPRPAPRPPGSSGLGEAWRGGAYQIPRPYIPRIPPPLLIPRRLPSLELLKPRELVKPEQLDRGQVPQRVEFPGQKLERLVVHKDADSVTIQRQRRIVDRVRRVLEPIHDRLVSQPRAGLPPIKDVLLSYQEVSGRVLHKVGGRDAPWLSITKESRVSGDELSLRLGAPHPRAGKPESVLASFPPRPESPSAGSGFQQWIDVTHATADLSAQARPAGPPGDSARPVLVTTPNGTASIVSQIGNHVRARGDDPILGLNGPEEGAAFLSDFPRVDTAMRSAAQAKDGLLRGVRLGEDGVALAGADGVILVAPHHPWAVRVQRAIDSRPSQQPLIRIEDGRAVHVDRSVDTIFPRSERTRMRLGDVWDPARGDIYFHEKLRSMLVLEDGLIVPEALPRDTLVIVQAAVVADRLGTERTASQPDVHTYGGAEWWQMSGTGSSAGTGSTASPGSGVAPATNGQVLLVCPDIKGKIRGCDE